MEQAENLNMDDVIVVPSDGSKIVAVQRTDLDLEKDAKARELAYADNRIAEIDLKWDYDQILKDAEVIPIDEWFSEEELEEFQIQAGNESLDLGDNREKKEKTDTCICPKCGFEWLT